MEERYAHIIFVSTAPLTTALSIGAPIEITPLKDDPKLAADAQR